MKNYQSILASIQQDIHPYLHKGAVADYIPALANINPLCKTYPNLDSVVFASCFNMLPKLTLSVGVNTPQADTV
jgi:hypothetical protein